MGRMRGGSIEDVDGKKDQVLELEWPSKGLRNGKLEILKLRGLYLGLYALDLHVLLRNRFTASCDFGDSQQLDQSHFTIDSK